MKKFLYLLCAALLLMPLLCACDSAEPGITPVNESYKFTPTSDTVYTPSLVVDWSFKYNISTETEDGTAWELTLPCGSELSVNPSLVIAALREAAGENVPCAVCRLRVLDRDGNEFA